MFRFRSMAAATACALALALSAALAVGCASEGAQQASGAEDAAQAADAEDAGEEPAAPKPSNDEVKAVLDSAVSNPYQNVTFDVKNETISTGMMQDDDGNVQMMRQSLTVAMSGQLDTSTDEHRMHMVYQSYSTSSPDRSDLEFYELGDATRILQDDVVFEVDTDEVGAESLYFMVASPISQEQVDSVCEMATSMSIEERGDDTLVSVTLNPARVLEENLVDVNSLPEGATLSSMVVNYTIGADNHIRLVRTMAQTAGSPSYTVNETATYTDYDATEVPAAPEPTQLVQEAQESYETVYYYTEDTGTTETVDATGGDGGDASSEQGRAYITDYDGNIHYLDEPGSEIRDLGGATVFIDADGEWYFLSVGDEEPQTTTDPIDVDAILAEEAAGNGEQ